MRRFPGLVVFACAIFFAPAAGAQIHWDVSAEGGVMKRFLAAKPAGAHDAGFGPAAQLAGHVALLPLIHVGAYLGGDDSPIEDGRDRLIGDAGAHVQVMLPLFPRSMRGWLYSGFGYAGQKHGGFLEVPFGLGVSYKFWPGWSVFGDLGGKVAFADHGSAYRGGNSEDRFALSLSVGILLDR